MLKKLQRISSEIRAANPYWQYGYDTYSMPNGNTGEYHYVLSRGSVFVIPQLDEDRFILLRQYRYLNERPSIEFPGGGMDAAYSPEDNARRELREEAGALAASLRKLGEFNPYNGVTNELCSVFLARGLSPTAANPEDSEEFEKLELNRRQINELIRCGELWDGMTIAAWFLFLNTTADC